MMKTAKYIKRVDGFSGQAELYEMDPPHEGHTHVIVSATVVPYGGGPETYIFPANENGDIVDWLELDGSYRGALNHAEALENAGYTIE